MKYNLTNKAIMKILKTYHEREGDISSSSFVEDWTMFVINAKDENIGVTRKDIDLFDLSDEDYFNKHGEPNETSS